MKFPRKFPVAVIVSADFEWRIVRENFPDEPERRTPMGEWFFNTIGGKKTLFFHGGYGKVHAAASTQYVIDNFSPHLIINLGTCGGFEGVVRPFDIILAEKTLIYDVFDMAGYEEKTVRKFTVDIDLSWLGDALSEVRRGIIATADMDVRPENLDDLKNRFGAIAGDWESGAIAFVASRNNVQCVILRGVSDVVGPSGAEINDNGSLWEKRTREIMPKLLSYLPRILELVAGQAKE